MDNFDKLCEVENIAQDGSWDNACQWAEEQIPELHDFLETWGSHCGAPRPVFRGHLLKLLLDCVRVGET